MLNHLDIVSLKCLEDALNVYDGALLVVSHDREFLKNIKIDRFITINSSK